MKNYTKKSFAINEIACLCMGVRVPFMKIKLTFSTKYYSCGTELLKGEIFSQLYNISFEFTTLLSS